GVAGHEADGVNPRHGAQQVEQVGEVHLLPFVQHLAVTVDVLAQQGDLLVAGFHQALELGQDVRRAAALFPAADVGHDAVGAEVVAPVHEDRKSTRLNSSHVSISYAVFCLKKKNIHYDEAVGGVIDTL